MFKFSFAVLLVALGISAQAQLAITEVMSSASTNKGPDAVVQGPDFWELTNFGTNTVDLTGYRFNDSEAVLGGDADSVTLNGVFIGPGESILLVQRGTTVVTNRDDFLNWWGAASLPAGVQVLFYTGNGLSSSGDSIVLWNATAVSDLDTVDRVDFGEAFRGRSFTYDTNTAAFGNVSTNGLLGAFKAVSSDDEGSPGRTAGPVPLAFVQQPLPVSQSVPVGLSASFTALAKGLPRPRYQWRHAGVAIPDATQSSLNLSNIQVADGGAYTVVIANGLKTMTSSVATLTVTATPVEPTFTLLPKSLEAFENQTVQFTAQATGSPTPVLQWKANGVDLPGETGPTLTFYGVQPSQAATYSVTASSTAGSKTATATLTVGAKPRLLITEVHSTGSTGFQDWWELTSFDTVPHNLKGWRWDDASRAIGTAVTLTNDLVIHPGESVVLVEILTAAQFRAWWTNLPADLQIGSYAGSGVGLSSAADEVNLWNAATLAGNELSERICGVTFAVCPVGTTFVYDPEAPPLGGVFATYSSNTVAGITANGLLLASNGSLGSPGRVVAPVRLTSTEAGGLVQLVWNTAAGRSYVVESSASLSGSAWLPVTTNTASGSSLTFTEPHSAGAQYYRVVSLIPFVSEP